MSSYIQSVTNSLIETSFRELKYAIGLTGFHARKVYYIKQEVFAGFLLYNYC